jgi:hypothetical protein
MCLRQIFRRFRSYLAQRSCLDWRAAGSVALVVISLLRLRGRHLGKKNAPNVTSEEVKSRWMIDEKSNSVPLGTELRINLAPLLSSDMSIVMRG